MRYSIKQNLVLLLIAVDIVVILLLILGSQARPLMSG